MHSMMINEDEDYNKFDYDALNDAKYLEAFISEAMRYVPPVGSVDRVASQDYYIEKLDIMLPKGFVVDLAYDAIMKDPEYWPEPDLFKPERFLAENKCFITPGSFCPFGLGPRQCLGLKFALIEAKLGPARLVLNYRFEPAPETSFPPELAGHISLTWIKNPRVRFIRR